LGHYERFFDEDLNRFSNLTTGKVYWNILTNERAGEYLGETVQVHSARDQRDQEVYLQRRYRDQRGRGHHRNRGTIGDIESQPFLEAIRQVGHEVGPGNCLYIHVTLVPYLSVGRA
jgi:CTP synthase